VERAIELGCRADFRLGAALIKPSACEVVGPTTRQSVEPRVMQMLVALADAKGSTVTRDALIESCWDGRIVGQDAINRAAMHVRQISRGVAAGSFEIQTIPKIGFRLIVKDAASEAAAAAPPRRRRWVWAWTGGVACVVLTVGAVLAARNAQPGGDPALASGEVTLSPAVQDLTVRAAAAVFEGTPRQMAQGVSYFKAAARQAPQVSEIWGSLAMATTLNQANLAPAQQAAADVRIREAANRALELNPRESHGHAALVALRPSYGAWSAKARAIAEAAARATPNGPPMLRQQALFLAATGQTRAALAMSKRLYDMHPVAPFICADLLKALAANSRLEEADAIAAHAVQLWPKDHELWRARFQLALLEGDTGAALAMATDRSAWPVDARESDMALRAGLARAIASKRPHDADAVVTAYWRAGAEGQGYLEDGIVAAAVLNRPDAAFRMADRLYSRSAPVERFRFSDHIEYSRVGERDTDFWFGPLAARLRRDPRFPTLMERIGLAAFWRAGPRPDFCAGERSTGICSRDDQVRRKSPRDRSLSG
jgi:DNA-binding winged helix-turn-helix (wHTH) protein